MYLLVEWLTPQVLSPVLHAALTWIGVINSNLGSSVRRDPCGIVADMKHTYGYFYHRSLVRYSVILKRLFPSIPSRECEVTQKRVESLKSRKQEHR